MKKSKRRSAYAAPTVPPLPQIVQPAQRGCSQFFAGFLRHIVSTHFFNLNHNSKKLK